MLNETASAASMYVAAVAANPDNPELAYQAALWLDRDHQRPRAATYARHAAAKGHEAAKKLCESWN
ncbi:MAG: hypothetical protein JNK58_14035 [Phycisphaerae bacterium]|nr:hypothetical protein [Phycisphaerae bacterium]